MGNGFESGTYVNFKYSVKKQNIKILMNFMMILNLLQQVNPGDNVYDEAWYKRDKMMENKRGK